MTSQLLHAIFLKTENLLLFYFKLYLNIWSKEIYSFIYYYKKEKEVCSKYFSFKVVCGFSQTICQKSINDNKNKLMSRFG